MKFKDLINSIIYTKLDDNFLGILANKKYNAYLKISKEEMTDKTGNDFDKFDAAIKLACEDYKEMIQLNFPNGKEFKTQYSSIDTTLLQGLYLFGNVCINERLGDIKIPVDWNELRIKNFTKYLISIFVKELSESQYELNNADLILALSNQIVDCFMKQIKEEYPNYIIFIEYFISEEPKLFELANNCIEKITTTHKDNEKLKSELIQYAFDINLPMRIFRVFSYLHKLYKENQESDNYKIDNIDIIIKTEYCSGLEEKEEKFDRKLGENRVVYEINEDKANNNQDIEFIFKHKYKITEKRIEQDDPFIDEYFRNDYYELYNENNELIFEFYYDNQHHLSGPFEVEDIIREINNKCKINIFKYNDWVNEINELYDLISSKRAVEIIDNTTKSYENKINRFTYNKNI